MPLFLNRIFPNKLMVVIWHLTESSESLLKETPLTDEEQLALQKISAEGKKKEFLARIYVLKKACDYYGIPFLGIEKDASGKPHLIGREYYISLTHTIDYIGVVFSKKSAVGIDLEKPREVLFKILPRLFTPEEVALVGNRLHEATVFWCAKEALYKLYGKRSVDFRKNLQLFYEGENLKGIIDINETHIHCDFYITMIELYVLVIAY